jgi:hypothetical protein
MQDLRSKLNEGCVREKIVALCCVTLIAVLAILKLADPENIIINIIVAISSFIGGEANERRKIDKLEKEK